MTTNGGFRRGRSTLDNIYGLAAEIYRALAAGEDLIVVFLDIKYAAFEPGIYKENSQKFSTPSCSEHRCGVRESTQVSGNLV